LKVTLMQIGSVTHTLTSYIAHSQEKYQGRSLCTTYSHTLPAKISPMPASQPTTAKVTSLSHWVHLFHPVSGVFRLPSSAGNCINHLDIDLRFIEYQYADPTKDRKNQHPLPPHVEDIYLPNVVKLTLRGAEHVHDNEDRMDSLAELLCAINPVEVQWYVRWNRASRSADSMQVERC
jgi:hypothetical protein